MYIVSHIFLTLGGITLFLLGLKMMSESMEKFSGNGLKTLLANFTKNKYIGVLTGAFSTAVLQSSIATNVILVGFVSNGILSFYQASAVIMGTNIGTTVTAQLVSLSGENSFDITAIAGIVAFIGFLLTFSSNKKVNGIGGVMVGFGTLFLGLKIVNDGVVFFKNFQEFCNVFLVKNEILLLFNGIVITAIVQSSSAVTSIMILLASNSLLTFESSMFIILGANIGTCFVVIYASLNKSIEAQRTAVFNLAFNVVGTLILIVPLILFKQQIGVFFSSFSHGIEREIANFHTLFNVVVTTILLPILKPFTRFIEKIIKCENKVKQTKKTILVTSSKIN
jgi:phosphate:Na+ symporter